MHVAFIEAQDERDHSCMKPRMDEVKLATVKPCSIHREQVGRAMPCKNRGCSPDCEEISQ